jgi:hypothetical protein
LKVRHAVKQIPPCHDQEKDTRTGRLVRRQCKRAPAPLYVLAVGGGLVGQGQTWCMEVFAAAQSRLGVLAT